MPLPPPLSTTDLLPLAATPSSFRGPAPERVAFSSLIVGEGALVAECATILLEGGHAVRGIVSANAQVVRWAQDRGVALIAPGSDVAAAMRGALASHDDGAVDWIFSIVNPYILNADALSVARHGAINYHDAPLPRYAGMHATSWALMHGERRHAVSWHRVVPRVDAGELLKQVAVDIDPSDTAHTLNTKCYVAAIDGFRELVTELAAGTAVAVPQDESARTFFGRLRRPAAAAVVRWDRPAAELANLARGLELGPVANPLGRPRLLLEHGAVLATKLDVLAPDGVLDAVPGTVVRADDDVIAVRTGDGVLGIRGLRRLDGGALSLRDAAEAWTLRAGRRLPILDSETTARLEARDAASRRREEEWVQQLRTLAPLTLPYVRGAVAEGRAASIAGPVPAELRRALLALSGAADRGAGELLLAGCALYFRRVGDVDGRDVGLVSPAPALATVAERRLFSESVPVPAGVDLDAPFTVATADFLDAVRAAEARGPILRDVVTRYPELAALAGRPDALDFPVSVGLCDGEVPSSAAPCAGSDLTVLVARDGGSWAWCFDAARLDRADVTRMMSHVEALVTGAAGAPTCAVAKLPVMPPDELALVRDRWNRTERPFPREATIAELVSAQARRTPSAVALVHEGAELSYAELDARANRLAWQLRELGVGPEVRVGVCLPRTPELVVGLLAVLKAGGAYVPLDPAYPADRLAFMLADSDAAVVVTERALRDVVSGGDRRLVVIDDAEQRAALAARSAQPLPATAKPANLAYLIYTSGSTGKPKGVMIEHRSAVAFIAWAHETFAAAELAGVLAATSVCFDLSVFELFVTLSAGGTVILADDALALAGLPDAERVTLVNTVPSVMAELVRMDGVPASVRTVNLAGEPLATSLVDRLYALGTVERVNDLYGPSEDTTYSTWTRRLPGAPPTIGRPIANSCAYVLDARGALCPIGVPGELYLGGAGLARGYHARPELTAERFVSIAIGPTSALPSEPTSALPSGQNSADAVRLYRTGDQVRWRADGVLEYLGRLDFQVKIRGFRIELGEIEARLRAHAHVRDVVVVARSDEAERRLVAYVVADDAGRTPTAELRAHLAQTLPDYMVPAAFVWLPALPLSSNGKVDRKALPAPELDRTALDRAFVAPSTPTEQLLAELWGRVLRLDRVGVDDNFFELGGDSILMIQIVSLARRAGLALSARELFRHPTVAELARVVESVAAHEEPVPPSASDARARTLDAATLAQIGVAAREVEDVYALSPMQQGLLFHSLAGSDDAEYHIQVRFEVRGALDLAEYRAAWREATGRHPILRTAFVWEGVPQPVQVVLASVETPWREEDWRTASAPERAARMERLLEDDRRAGFELARAPLARVVVVRTGDAQYAVVWSFHHLLLDGWSAHAVLHEVSESYLARATGTTAPIECVRPYRDYIAELTREDPGAEAFWRERLAGFATPTPLGIDRRRTDVAGARYARDDFALSAEQSARLRAFAREHRVTLNTVFQGAWAVVLGRYAGSADVVLGATVTTRPSTIDGVERMVGLFLNSIPVRVQIPTDDCVAEWLRVLQEVQSESRAHEGTPLADIQRWSEIPQGTSLFDSLLVFENYPVAESSREARAVEFGAPDIIERTHYPLTLAVIPGPRIVVRAMFDATRFTDDAIARLHGHLATVLDAIASAPDARVGDLEILPAAERRLLRSFSATSLPALGEETVHARFAAAAASRPDAVALSTDDGTITYGELARRVNRMARVLRAHGAGRRTFVGLAMRPSADLVTAILAILESGAAFVPLDPGSPMERLSYVLDDIAAPVVLTERDVIARLPARDGTRMLVIEELTSTVSSEGDGPLPSAGTPDDPAYVMYTSGSTGRPKGVVVPHRGIVRLVRENNFMRIDADEVFLLLAPVSFDASTLELWGALLNGCRLVVPTSKVPAIERLGALIAEQGVTSIWLTAALFRHVVDTDLDALRPLRQLLAGGDVLPAEQVRRVLEELPELRLINGYGPTENTTFTCCHPVSTRDLGGSIPIGKPIANTTVYIVDASMRPVPIGVPGELWTGGAGVALGYLNQPALTAERFQNDLFATGLTSALSADAPDETAGMPTGAKLYRTGDRARWRPDGVVEFLGRFDSQVKLRGFRVEPEEVETTLAAHPDLRAAVVIVREDRPGDKRLVGYFIPSESAESAVDARALRAYLGARLPDYMIPSTLVRLDALPVNANGKVDRRALPAPALVADEERGADAAPRTPEETLLAQIWAEVLRVERVGIHDNYYDLGGDSILSIQIAARARNAGVPVSVSMLVRHHTVAELASSLERQVAPVRADGGPSSGTAPLTPIQRWFFELDPARRDHWNQAFLFRTVAELDEGALRGGIDALLRHHDALRLRFTASGNEWVQRYAPVGEPVPLWIEDLSDTSDAELTSAIATITERAAASLDIGAGPCLRVVYVRLGGTRGGRLLMAIHHLVVDGISWRILLEDLEAAYGALASGARVTLPPKTTSFQQWAADLSAHASSPTLRAEQPYWASVTQQPVLSLPLDGTSDAENTVGDARTLIAMLDEQETAELLQRVPSAYATQINDVLLVALADALGPWVGHGALLLDLEGHGREDIVPDLDLTRTVGWFTSVFPVRLPLGVAAGVGERLKAMKEMLRGVPRRGVGYGSLRYLASDAHLADAPAPQLVFNYLGQFDQLVADSRLLRFASEDSGPWLAAEGRRRHRLEINSLVLNGRLEFRWTFGTKLHDEETVRRLADAMLAALRAIIAHCRAPDASGRTPSDFPLVALTQQQVDRLAGDGKLVEEIAPLVPMQSLFLATTASGGDVGFEQWTFEIDGALDVAAFQRAWQLAAARHEILRTAFMAEGLDAPVQVILRQVDVPFVAHDWRDVDETTRAVRMRELLAADRAEGFRVDRAPLLRLALVRTGASTWTLVWSNHHLLLDRWSWPIVLRDVGIIYQSIVGGGAPALPPATPWRRYLRWLAERDAGAAESLWRAELAGIAARPVPRLAGATAGEAGGERRLSLTTDESARLANLARERRVTTNTLISAAWALWLARRTESSDVLFGVTLAGRPEAVQGIERLVGLCINNVPSRIRVEPAESLIALLARLEERQLAASPHAHVSLLDLQRWSGRPFHQRLFDTLLVFQHHGADDESAEWLGASNAVRMGAAETQTNYPLALVVGGRESLTLKLAYQGRFASAADADGVLEELRALLTALTALGDAPLGQLLDAMAPADRASAPAAERVVVPARSDVEWVVCQTWAELLGRDAVGVTENFFDLGGQSLVATQIVSRVRDAFHLELPISLLFEHPTVEAFARAVVQRDATPGRIDRIAAIIRRVEEMTLQELREARAHE